MSSKHRQYILPNPSGPLARSQALWKLEQLCPNSAPIGLGWSLFEEYLIASVDELLVRLDFNITNHGSAM